MRQSVEVDTHDCRPNSHDARISRNSRCSRNTVCPASAPLLALQEVAEAPEQRMTGCAPGRPASHAECPRGSSGPGVAWASLRSVGSPTARAPRSAVRGVRRGGVPRGPSIPRRGRPGRSRAVRSDGNSGTSSARSSEHGSRKPSSSPSRLRYSERGMPRGCRRQMRLGRQPAGGRDEIVRGNAGTEGAGPGGRVRARRPVT